MKTAKIYKFDRKKHSIEENVNTKKPFVIEFDGEILRTEKGTICKYETYEKAENTLITYANKKLKELQQL